MVNAGLNLRNEVNIKQVCQTTDRNYSIVNPANKGLLILKSIIKILDDYGKIQRTTKSFAPGLSCFVPH
jgi:hypothetical protein